MNDPIARWPLAAATLLLITMVGCATTQTGAGPSVDNPFESLETAGIAAVESPAAFDAPTVVLAGGTVLTATGERYEPGFVVLEGGLIQAVGDGAAPDVAGAHVIDVSGHFVTPGLIDTHSHLGVYPSPDANAHGDGNEATSPTTAGVWAEHSFWPQDPGIERAVAGGVTTIQVLPGSANLIGGRGVVLHMVPQRGPRAMRLPGAPETLKMACGENPKRVYGERGGPSTRMGNTAGHRAAFIKAKSYLQRWRDWAKEASAGVDDAAAERDLGNAEEVEEPAAAAGKPAPPMPDRDLQMETLAQVLTGDVLVQIHCYRADDMIAMMQVADEFDFEIRSFHHALEAYKIRDILAAKDISVSTWADWWGFKLEAYDGIPENAAMVAQAGGKAIIHSDSSEGIQRLNQEAAKALWIGRHAGIELDDNEALRWITMNPAWALGIDDQVGSLEVGKRADVVVWDGDPLSVYSSARWVFIDGALRFDKDRQTSPWSDFELGQEVQP